MGRVARKSGGPDIGRSKNLARHGAITSREFKFLQFQRLVIDEQRLCRGQQRGLLALVDDRSAVAQTKTRHRVTLDDRQQLAPRDWGEPGRLSNSMPGAMHERVESVESLHHRSR